VRLLYRLVALVLGVLVAMLVAEAGLRLSGMGFGNSPMEPDYYLHHIHPKSYTFVQQHPSGELGGFEIEYNTEGRVFRGSHATPVIPAGQTRPCKIALMGDSFAEGGQVPFDKSFAGLLESAARDRCEVRNYGTRSYSPAIYLVQWTREVQPWHPDLVFLLLFGNDVREDFNYLQSSDRDARGFPTAIHGPDDGFLFSQLRKLYVARFVRMVALRAQWVWEHQGQEQWTVGGVVEENPEWGGETPALVKEIAKRAKDSGSRMVVMSVPSRYRLMGDGHIKVEGDFHATVKQFTAQNGIEFLDLFTPFERASKAGFKLFFQQDIHFAEEGHRVTAATIARSYPDYFSHGDEIIGPVVSAAFGTSPP
jgi:lysophospholipase L1-like esterase